MFLYCSCFTDDTLQVCSTPSNCSSDTCLIVSSLVQGKIEGCDDVYIDFSTFSISFFKRIRIPCLVLLQQRNRCSYLVIKKPLLFYPLFLMTPCSTNEQCRLLLQQSGFVTSQSL